jgi:LysM repeat protein
MMPGVEVLGTDLSWMSRSGTEEEILRTWHRWPIRLENVDRALYVAPVDLGISIDAKETAREAHRRGRFLEGIARLLRGQARVTVPPVLRFDVAVAEANLRARAEHLRVPAVNAGLRSAGGQVVEIPPAVGYAVDAPATALWLSHRVSQVVAEGRLPLVVDPVRPLIEDAGTAVARARQWLASPLVVRAYDPIADESLLWSVEPEVWGTWLSLSVSRDDPTELDVELDAEPVSAFLGAQSATLAPDRYLDLAESVAAVSETLASKRWDVRLRIYHGEQQYVVQLGETVSSIARDHGMPYPWLLDANPGIGDALTAGQTLTIPSPDLFLPLPIVEGKRIVVSISQQAMGAYEGDSVRWVWPVSTGIASSPTSPGVFQIQSHDPNAYASSWNLWMPYFMGIYRPVPTSDFMNGFHGFPTRDGTTLLWTGNLGHPITYGCILVSTGNGAALYEWAEDGVVVEIRP